MADIHRVSHAGMRVPSIGWQTCTVLLPSEHATVMADIHRVSHAGVRVSVGGSGARHCPSQVSLGGRLHHLPAAPTKRWYSLQMTPGEALAAAPDTPLQASTHC